jgi:hypothetical protein
VRTRVPVPEAVLAVIGITLLIVLGAVREERNVPNLDSYSSYDARSGGYRAWYELLLREGLNAARFERHWIFLDRSIATLICAVPMEHDQLAASAAAAPTGPAALEAWVKDGGTVVILGGFLSFDALHFHVVPRDEFGSKGISEATIGRGKIIYMKDEGEFTNARIGNRDAARLAYSLVLPSRAGVVAFEETLHGHLIPEHWWQAAPRRLVVAIIGACVVLAIALFGATIRLGPPILPPLRREAASAEYLEAVASLYARADAKRKVLQDVTNSVRRTAARSDAMQDELADRLERADVSAALIELDKLATARSLSERAFIQGVAKAQRLRKELGNG